jgi:hypothetical protein
MLRLAADENLTNGIIRGLMRHGVQAEIVRVQDAGLSGADDPGVLAWAAAEGRILITHDSHTVPLYANQRTNAGLRMPGVFIVPRSLSVGQAIEDLLLLCECSSAAEWEGIVFYLPL